MDISDMMENAKEMRSHDWRNIRRKDDEHKKWGTVILLLLLGFGFGMFHAHVMAFLNFIS